MMYRNDNKNAWPDDLKALEKYVKVAQVFTNPTKPDLKPGYVYVKPVEPIADPSAHAVIYEAHKEFGSGLNVGFADGHVEFVADKDRFNGLIAALAQQ
jgi:prepilin-type processing-associated H-X9-DG protein